MTIRADQIALRCLSLHLGQRTSRTHPDRKRLGGPITMMEMQSTKAAIITAKNACAPGFNNQSFLDFTTMFRRVLTITRHTAILIVPSIRTLQTKHRQSMMLAIPLNLSRGIRRQTLHVTCAPVHTTHQGRAHGAARPVSGSARASLTSPRHHPRHTARSR